MAPDAPPFWKTKRLEEMTPGEWESLCDGCGRCCLEKVNADDDGAVHALDVACELLDLTTGRCTDYPNRHHRDVGCLHFTPATMDRLGIVPESCGYDRVRRGLDLTPWHPLRSGTRDSVRQAGISVAHRAIHPALAGRREYHVVDWPAHDGTTNPNRAWLLAAFGGVNASVPTPFGRDGGVDLDAMAAHCFWLLASGCHGLAVLDHAGEASALRIDERIAVLRGIVDRGVPASKLLAGIGPAQPADARRIASVAVALGVRGIMLAGPVPPRALPHQVMPPLLSAMADHLDGRALLYWSVSAPPAAASACLTGLEAWLARRPDGLAGVRDESSGAVLAHAALRQGSLRRLEVYAADEIMLAGLVEQGGAGVIGPRANLFGRLLRECLDPAVAADLALRLRRAIRIGCEILDAKPLVPALKVLLADHTERPAWSRVRLPLRRPGPDQIATLLRAFHDTGIRLPPLLDADPRTG